MARHGGGAGGGSIFRKNRAVETPYNGWVGENLSIQTHPLPIIFLTGHGDIPMSVGAMKAGAIEFLTKPFREQDLLDAIRQAIDRDRAAREERRELAELRRRYHSLTPRERDVMAGIVAGLLNKQIAAEFGTSEVTVKEQRGQVMLKMQAGSLADLVRTAARLRIPPPGVARPHQGRVDASRLAN